MILKPLQQWYCDRCDEIISKPEEGWVHWRRDRQTKRVHSIEILHHLSASPLRPEREFGCYPPNMELDMHLDRMIGPRGMADLLSIVDVGEYHDPDGREVGRVDLRNWAEAFRRLHIPHYEEARRYFDRARADGELDGVNEVALYTQDVLRSLILLYGGGLVGDDEST